MLSSGSLLRRRACGIGGKLGAAADQLSADSTGQGKGGARRVPTDSAEDPYLYEIQNAAGTKLEWLNALIVVNENFGGLDVPRPPG